MTRDSPGGVRRGLGTAFGRLVVANLSSSLADGIARTAAPLLAARLTDDPLLISAVAAAALLPWLLFAIPAGVLVDRVDRRRALALANGVRAGVALGLVVLVATGTLTIWLLLLVVVVFGAMETVYDGAVRAVVPSLVGRADLPRANSRIEGGELVVQNFVAGPFTSALFAAAVVVPLGVNAGAFAVAAGLALALPAAAAGRRRSASGTGTGTGTGTGSGTGEPDLPWYRQLADGFRYLAGHRMLRTLWLLSTVVGLCWAAGQATWVLFVLDRLRVPEALFGTFMLAGAVGGILGAMAVGPARARFGTGVVMATTNLLATVSLLAVGLLPTVAVAAAGLALSSAAVTAWNVLMMSLRQSVIPDHLLGRVHGTWRTLLWGTMPVGSLLGGLLARVDLTTPMVAGGAVATVVAALSVPFLARLPDPEDAGPGTPAAG